MDADDLERKLTPQTRAVVVQHTFGIPADMKRICHVAERNGISIIEDCCHTLISKYNEKTVGSFGVGCFYSFEWGKPIVAGIGGSIRINDPALFKKVQTAYAFYRSPDLISQVKIELQYRAFSLLYRPALYWPIRTLFHWLGSLGLAESNYNPVGHGQIADDFRFRMAPAVKRRMLKKIQNIESQTHYSRWVSDQYRHRIVSNAVSHPVFPEGCDMVFARYPLLAKDKPALLSKARSAHVELAEWYATVVHPLAEQDLSLVHYNNGCCPNAEDLCRQVVTLPIHGAVRKRDIDNSIEFLNMANV